MKRLGLCVAAGLVVAGFCSGGLKAQAQSKDEQEIRALEDRFASAFRAKDVDAIMKFYVPGSELFVFDMDPPRQHLGWADYKKDWQDYLAALKGPVQFDLSELSVTTDGKLAFGHSIQHVAGTMQDGSPFDITVRVTDDYRKIDGKWLIAQEHVSVPVDLTTGKPDLMSKP
jgi:ketosteroid isomerase-like protein